MIEPKLKCRACVWYDEENHRCNLLKGLLKGNHKEQKTYNYESKIDPEWDGDYCKIIWKMFTEPFYYFDKKEKDHFNLRECTRTYTGFTHAFSHSASNKQE